MSTIPQIYVTDQDFQRLQVLISEASGAVADALDEELARANVVAQKDIPRDTVTMNSKIAYVDEVTGDKHVVSLVYPQEANFAEGKLSVLAPIGVALLGLKVGDRIDWKLPSGQVKKIKLEAVIYQPEAEGNLNL